MLNFRLLLPIFIAVTLLSGCAANKAAKYEQVLETAQADIQGWIVDAADVMDKALHDRKNGYTPDEVVAKYNEEVNRYERLIFDKLQELSVLVEKNKITEAQFQTLKDSLNWEATQDKTNMLNLLGVSFLPAEK